MSRESLNKSYKDKKKSKRESVNVTTKEGTFMLRQLKGKFGSSTEFKIIVKPLGNYDIQSKV